MLTQAELKDLLNYDAETGIFTWNVSAGTVKKGSIAGYVQKRGYVQISIKSKAYWAHRLAWLYVNGCNPSNMIDHINGNKSDNRIENLREATGCQNQYNSTIRKDSKSGEKNVLWHKSMSKWMVQLRVNKKAITIGYFDDLELAKLAAQEARKKYHNEFARSV